MSSGIALFLDIDGTLLEHQAHPEAVKVDEPLRQLLREAYFRLDGALALVTGRNIAMADRLFLPLELPVAGIYGLEMRLRPGEAVAAALEPEALSRVAERLGARFAAVEGVYFERKGPVLAIHIRAAPGMLDEVLAAAREALPELGEEYRIAVGNAGIELIPVGGVKASAVERFLRTPPFAGRKPVFIGDDVSDESAFDYVNALEGLSIRVKPDGPTAARRTLPDVAAVREWIRETVFTASPA
jgi:trehalose 6-phosphate phosphatase